MRKKPGSYKRCTDELKESVRVKRAETFRRSEQDLQKLVREGKAVNFSAVARSAKVSIAWLYKEPEVRRRIEHPRGQMQPQKVVIPSPERISEASLRAQNNALKKRDQELTHEIKLLNERIRFAFGIIASNNLPIPD